MVLFAACLLAALVLAFVALPPDVRELVGENCRSVSTGRIRIRYVLRELASLWSFYFRILFFAAILGIIVTFALLAIDKYVIEMPFVIKGLAAFDLDPWVWKWNATHGPGNLLQQFTRHFVGEGGTAEEARELLSFLFHCIPIAVVLSMAFMVLGMRITSRNYQSAIEELVWKEAARNRRRIRDNFHRTAAPAQIYVRGRHRS